MPHPSQIVLYIAAAILLAVTPGPGLFYVAARTLVGGRAEGVASGCGTGLGGMVHVLAGSLGVSAVVLASAQLFTALKLLGAAYLLWIGLRTFQSGRRETVNALSGDLAAPALGRWRAFREGVLVEALNPKTAMFFLAFLPQFIDPLGHVALQFAALGVVSVALNTCADIGVAVVAGQIQSSVAARPLVVRRLREGSGAAMMTLGFGLAFAKLPRA